MKRLLLQAAKSSLFLRRPEGRRFLAHVLTLHPSLVAEVASVMRNMVGPGAGCTMPLSWALLLCCCCDPRRWRGVVGSD